MKKFLFASFSIFACMMFLSCSDEFGCMYIDYYCNIYLPENEGIILYETINFEKSQMKKIQSNKEGYDLFVYYSGTELQTRRDYKKTIKAYIEYVDGTSEVIETTIEIPYLEDEGKDIAIVIPSKKYTTGIEFHFKYSFSRSF